MHLRRRIIREIYLIAHRRLVEITYKTRFVDPSGIVILTYENLCDNRGRYRGVLPCEENSKEQECAGEHISQARGQRRGRSTRHILYLPCHTKCAFLMAGKVLPV